MRQLRIGVVGCGTAGAAAALFLHRDEHRVEAFEQVPEPAPVGAGILLQPTGMAVLGRLGLLDDVIASGARIDRVHGVTSAGRTVMDIAYADLRADLFGLGVHRGSLFMALFAELRRAGVPLRLGTCIVGLERSARGATLVDATGGRHGPYDLVVIADGARSLLRGPSGVPARVKRYPWGALWAIVRDPDGTFAGALDQVYRGTEEMMGFLPTGRPERGGPPLGMVSLFWSLRADRLEEWRRRGLAAWKRDVRALSDRADPLIEQLSDADQLTFAGYHDVRMRSWHNGGAVVVGDAGHAMSPQLGQGANLALQDAWTLSRCLREVDRLEPALERYSRDRHANLRFYALASRWMTPLFQSSGNRLSAPRDLLLHRLARIGPLRRQMLLTLTGAKAGILRTLPDAELGRSGTSPPAR